MHILKHLSCRLILALLLILPATSAYAEMGRRSNICGSWNNYCNGPSAPITRTYPTPGPQKPTPPPNDGGIQAAKDEAAYRERQARIAFLAGHWEEAIKHAKICSGNDLGNSYCAYVKAVASYNWDLEIYHISDFTQLSIPRLEYHIYDYKLALRYNPNNPEIAGILQGMKDALAEKKAAYETKMQRNDAYNRGMDYFNNGDYEYAADSFRRAVDLDHEDIDAWQWLGWSLTKAGNYKAAVGSFRDAIAHGFTDSYFYIHVIELLLDHPDLRQGYDEAVDYAQRFQRLHPRDIKAHKLAAEAYIDNGQKYDANKAYEQALAIEPDNIYVLSDAVKNSFENYDIDQSEQYLNRLAAACGEDCGSVPVYRRKIKQKRMKYEFNEKYEKSEASQELVDHYYMLGDNDSKYIVEGSQAIDGFTEDLHKARKQIAEHPDNIDGYRSEADALSALWRHDEAAAAMEKAVLLEPNNYDLIMAFVDSLEGAESYQKAMIYADRAHRLKPGNKDMDEWIERLINDEYIKIRYGFEGKNYDLAPDSLSPDFRNKVLEKSAAMVEEELKTEPDDPKLLALKDQLRKSRTAFEQAQVTAAHGKTAARATSPGQAHAEAMIGFDTAEVSAPTPVLAAVPADPVVPDNKRTGTIQSLEDKRTQLREKKKHLEQKLLDFGAEPDQVAVAKVKQEISNLENMENFLNFSIEEELRVGAESSSRDALNSKKTTAQKAQEEPDVTEMSIGDVALTERDKEISEKELAEKKKIWEADTRKAVREYIKRKQKYDARERQTLAEMTADPILREAITKSDRLWKEAEAEYERRKESQDNQPANSEDDLLTDAVLNTHHWPGKRNPESPLPNPVAEEDERFQAVSEIYGKLKERDRLLHIFEKMAEEMDEAGY